MGVHMEKNKRSMQQAFPCYLEQDVAEVFEMMPRFETGGDFFTVKMYGERIRIPERIYGEEVSKEIREKMTVKQKKILFCFYSRHNDGYVREKNITDLMTLSHIEKWNLPYILRLSGEYVLEILEVIHAHFEVVNNRTLQMFLHENPTFYMRLTSRVASYWDCYYRDRYPKREAYIGFKLLYKIQDLM